MIKQLVEQSRTLAAEIESALLRRDLNAMAAETEKWKTVQEVLRRLDCERLSLLLEQELDHSIQVVKHSTPNPEISIEAANQEITRLESAQHQVNEILTML